jgi:hypothetical protein
MPVVSVFIRRTAVAAAALAVLAATTALPGSADVRQNIMDKACADFATTMAQMKNKSSTATPNPMSAKLKSNTEARTTYVNIVAAPLLNKLIDCDMIPGGS